MNIKEKYNDIFLVERNIDGQQTKRVTVFYLLGKDKVETMEEFMETHNINNNTLKEHPNEIMDFYNDMIKFQNEQKCYLNHLTIFSYFDDDLSEYLIEVEKNSNFIKWITIDDELWLKKLYKYFITEKWFSNSDNKFVL